MQLFLVAQIVLCTPPISFEVTPESLRVIDFVRNCDEIWANDCVWVKCYGAQNFRVIQVYKTHNPQPGDEYNLFYFDYSNPKSLPNQIHESRVQFFEKGIKYGEWRFELLFQRPISRTERPPEKVESQ